MSNYFRDSVISGITRTSAEVDQGLRSYLLRVYNYMALGLALTGVVAMATASSPKLMMAIFNSQLQWVVLLLPVVMVFFISARINSIKASTAQAFFWAYAGAMGLSLSSVFLIYTGVSVAKVFFISSGTFAATSMYGYVTKRDLSHFGSFMFMAFIGLVFSSLANIFIRSSGFEFVISLVGVALFIGMTAYDTQRIKSMYFANDSAEVATKKSIMGALTLYIDFINMFMYMLRLLSDRR